jgi:hypothetical protein
MTSTEIENQRALPMIKVVGMSASGKSTLVAGLRQAGYDARPISQEHSHVSDLWKQFGFPRVLIYLDATLGAQQARRSDVTWDEENWAEEQQLLAHGREHADLRIDTTQLGPAEVLKVALAYLAQGLVRHAAAPLPPVAATGSAIRSLPVLGGAVATAEYEPKRRHRPGRKNVKADQA